MNAIIILPLITMFFPLFVLCAFAYKPAPMVKAPELTHAQKVFLAVALHKTEIQTAHTVRWCGWAVIDQYNDVILLTKDSAQAHKKFMVCHRARMVSVKAPSRNEALVKALQIASHQSIN